MFPYPYRLIPQAQEYHIGVHCHFRLLSHRVDTCNQY